MTKRTAERKTRGEKSNPTRVARAAMGIIKHDTQISAGTLLKTLKQAKRDVKKEERKQKKEKEVEYSTDCNKIAVQGGHGPIYKCMESLRNIRSDLKLLELAMSLEFERVVREGENQQMVGFFKNMRAVHFTSNARLTMVCEEQNGFNRTTDKHSKLEFEASVMDIQNRAKEGHPGKYEQANVNHAHKFYSQNVHDVAYSGFNGSVKDKTVFVHRNFHKNFRFVSMILSDAQAAAQLKTNLTHFVESFQKTMETKATGPDAAVLNSIKDKLKTSMVQSIANIANQDNKKDIFIFHTGQDSRLFYTKNYEVCFCQSSAHRVFKEGSEEYKVMVYRKMIFASLNEKTVKHKDETYNIPLCEEMVIHLYKKTDNEFVLFERACLVYAKLKLASVDSGGATSQWHYLGKNAFTLNHPSDVCIRADPHERAMFMSGFIAKRLADVNAGSKDVSDVAVGVFKDLFKDKVSETASEFDAAIKSGGKMPNKLLDALVETYKLNHGNNPITEGQKDAFTGSITDNSILQKSFLASQHAEKLTYVNGDKYFFTRQCFASFSFCITVLSPYENPAINAVFEGAYGATASFLKGDTEAIAKPVDYTCKEMGPSEPDDDGAAGENNNGTAEPSPSDTFIENPPVKRNQSIRQTIRDSGMPNASSEFHQPYRCSSARDIITKNGTRFPRSFHSSTLPPELELELELL